MVDRLGLELSTKLIKEIKYATAVISMPIVSSTLNTIIPSEILLSDQLTGLFVEVIDGNGKGQIRKIISNTETSITVAPDFTTVPEPFSIITIHEILKEVNSGVDIPQYIAPTTAATLPSNICTVLFLTAASTNTGYISWGFSSSVPNLLDAAQSIALPVSNSNLIYVSGNGTDTVGGSVLE